METQRCAQKREGDSRLACRSETGKTTIKTPPSKRKTRKPSVLGFLVFFLFFSYFSSLSSSSSFPSFSTLSSSFSFSSSSSFSSSFSFSSFIHIKQKDGLDIGKRLSSRHHSTTFQSTRPLPSLSSSTARPTTRRLSALKGSVYPHERICCSAAARPPLLESFSSMT